MSNPLQPSEMGESRDRLWVAIMQSGPIHDIEHIDPAIDALIAAVRAEKDEEWSWRIRERIHSFIAGVAGKRLTYAGSIQ